MPYPDFLRASLITVTGVAVAVGAASIAVVVAEGSLLLTVIMLAWWPISTALGLWGGRRSAPNERLRELLTNARTAHSLPEPSPLRLLVNRLWPLGAVAVAAIALARISPALPILTTGFSLLWALASRNQAAAVLAIEERDGVRFFVEPTSPFSAIRLVRTPGWTKTLSR